jgi:hypothetical protein
MLNVHVDYIAVLAGGVAAWIVGAIWYGVLGKRWMSTMDKVKAQLPGSSSRTVPLVVLLAGDLVMAWVLAHAIAATGEVTIRSGAITAAFLWLGFIATTVAVSNMFAHRKFALTLIDGSLWLAATIVAGIVIGAFR